MFLREYAPGTDGKPHSTGKFLDGLDAGQTYPGSPSGLGGIGTWAAVKLQAASLLGLALKDTDIGNVPTVAADVYGNFIPGPARGLPMWVTKGPDGKANTADDVFVEGNIASPVPTPADVVHFDTPFLTDVAHNADPGSVGPCSTTGGAAGCLEPDADNTPNHDFAGQPAGTYDDELLNSHFICGDGRCNENIALSTVHQIFHSEHNRLVDDETATLERAGNEALKADYLATNCASSDCTTHDPALPTTFTNGERMVQAARFVTEMEYQHLVFEEFARKIQPAVRPFHLYNADINAAIPAEYAHAVYRFGHSMLDDDVRRETRDANNNLEPNDNSVPLLTAFLNPPLFFDDSANGHTYTAREAAGAIVMGTADQTGNELDEFVADTLRNNLVGLPLDLAATNIARARDAGVPPLNVLRKQIFADTNDGQLAPYTSWADFGIHLKHPESLVNFIAAYGTHPTVRDSGPDGILGNGDDVTTVAGKRAAAQVLVNATSQDSFDFLYSQGAWLNDADDNSTTGLDSVDVWVGGLAEITNLFGGLLGSTMNYVFEHTLENLQDGDRLYYLARTPGMNLRTQLEGNSFSEMIMRNTDGTNSLKADSFSTADCKFQLSNLDGTPAGFTAHQATVADDASTDCDESLLLTRQPNGTIQYRQFNTVDPSGINGQSVYNGTDSADRIFGGNDNDTFWGGLGNDVIEGNGGDDVILGGEGNDIETDLGGADVLKGGPGNDALDGGIGDDIFMGGDDSDFINGGANDNEAFAGPGNDFMIAGQGADAVQGDGGDDWIEGGSGQDLLIGDHSAPFFDDPAEVAPGNDIFVGQVGENDYDAEGGDDLMAQNSAIDRNAGAGGFDWAFHQYDTVGADDDMEINNNLPGLPIQLVVNRDRWQETEADSGSAFNDVMRGTTVAPATLGGAGFTGCDALDQAGLDRIAGLDQIVPPLNTPVGDVVALSASGSCPLAGPNVWGDGDILIGGLGSDTIEGRDNNDVIDGDRYVTVAITLNDGVNPPSTTDLMEHKALTGPKFGGAADMTLQQAVFAGLVDPGNLSMTRQIVTPAVGPADCGAATSVNCDTAVFSGPRANYTITSPVPAAGDAPFTLVTDNAGTDGADVVRNVEQLKFTDTTVSFGLPGAPTIGQALAGNARATVNFTAPTNPTIPPVTGFSVRVTNATTHAVVRTILTGNLNTTFVVGNGVPATNVPLVNGTSYTFAVAAVNLAGTGPFSAESNTVTPAAAPAPVLIAQSPASGAVNFPVANNITARFSTIVQGVSQGTNTTAVNGSTNVRLFLGTASGVRQNVNVAFNVLNSTVTINPTANLLPSTVYTVVITGGTCVPAAGIRTALGTCAAFATTSWSFTTEVANPAPTVIATNPAANASNVTKRAPVITATFSEDVQGVTSTTATIARTGGGVIAATVSMNHTTHVVTITPAANLRANTSFTVTLRGGATAIRDLTGLPLVTKTWSFTTGA